MNNNLPQLNDFWMEDVSSVSVEAMKLIEERLKKFNIVLTTEQEDSIFNAIWKVLEDVSNANYRREM